MNTKLQLPLIFLSSNTGRPKRQQKMAPRRRAAVVAATADQRLLFRAAPQGRALPAPRRCHPWCLPSRSADMPILKHEQRRTHVSTDTFFASSASSRWSANPARSRLRDRAERCAARHRCARSEVGGCVVRVRNAVPRRCGGRKRTAVPPQICSLTTHRPSIRRRANPEMAIFSPFPGVGPSVIADSVCPIMPAWLSPPAIAVAVDFVVSVFPFARSEFATPHWAYNRSETDAVVAGCRHGAACSTWPAIRCRSESGRSAAPT